MQLRAEVEAAGEAKPAEHDVHNNDAGFDDHLLAAHDMHVTSFTAYAVPGEHGVQL